MKKTVLLHKEELNYLTSQRYQLRQPLEKVEPYLDSNVIKLITGPRRAGKSVFALQILKGRNYAYLNFDDSSLLDNFDEDALMQVLAEVYPGYTHLLLDEVQNLDNWDVWVSKLKRNGVNPVITGSNARMLSSEMATVLTDRYFVPQSSLLQIIICVEELLYLKLLATELTFFYIHPNLPDVPNTSTVSSCK